MRPVQAGSLLRVLNPCPHWEAWRGVVRRVFEDGATVIDPVEGVGDFPGAYILHDLTAFCHADGTPIEPHPALKCEQLRGGCSRNPRGECVRCGDL